MPQSCPLLVLVSCSLALIIRCISMHHQENGNVIVGGGHSVGERNLA